jgi:hypothetical protein
MKDNKLITSVIGFDFSCSVKDRDGIIVKRGIRSTVNVHPNEHPDFSNRLSDRKAFTNFNHDLLKQVIEYRKNNE